MGKLKARVTFEAILQNVNSTKEEFEKMRKNGDFDEEIENLKKYTIDAIKDGDEDVDVKIKKFALVFEE